MAVIRFDQFSLINRVCLGRCGVVSDDNRFLMMTDSDDTPRSLGDLRREIDAIDDEIHALIRKRTAVVQHVASAKKAGSTLPVRPAREAAMLRRLKAAHDGSFPFAALARMWHEMIAASTRIQAYYTIAVHASADRHALWDLARDQFGSQTPIRAIDGAVETLLALLDGKVDIAVLPVPSEKEDWWKTLADYLQAHPDEQPAPQIIERLPFAGVGCVRGDFEEAIVVARVTPESTGNDRTVIATGQGLEEMDGFLDTNLNGIRLGVYANPVALPDRELT